MEPEGILKASTTEPRRSMAMTKSTQMVFTKEIISLAVEDFGSFAVDEGSLISMKKVREVLLAYRFHVGSTRFGKDMVRSEC